MNREDFKYFKCECGNVIIVPFISTSYMGDMCKGYNQIETCCNKPDYYWGTIKDGLEYKSIRESDLPKALRDKMEVTYEECNGPRMIMKRCNKRTDVTIVKDKIRIIREGRQVYETDIF